MWGLFNSKSPPIAPFQYVIIEYNDEFVVDEEFIRTGESEGWLELTGWYHRNGVNVQTYRHIG